MDLYLDGDSDEDVSAMNPDDDECLRRTEEADERDHSGDSGGEQMSQASGPIERTQAAVPVACVKKTKRQKQMSKTERQRLMTQIRQVDRNKLFVEAEEQLSKQLHFSVFEERGKFFTTLFTSHKSEVSQLCDALVGEFCSIYESCATGKEKCSRFHMQWHSYCSTFLIEPTSSSEPSCQSTSVKIWTTLSSGIRKEVKNPVIISLCSAVYDLLLVKVRTELSGMFSEDSCQPCQSLSSEPEEVYYRFCGAAMAGMYKERYKMMKSPSCKRKDDIGKELTVLDWMRLNDKSILPTSLQYKDEGGMYFPKRIFVPFIRDVDSYVREHANEVSFARYGSKVIEVATHELQNNQLLKPKFKDILLTLISGDLKGYDHAVNVIYQELIRKLCNTRLNEFITTHKLNSARSKGSATLAGQNLRDSLLTHHTNLKTSAPK